MEGLRGDRQAEGEGDAVSHLCQAVIRQQHRQPRAATRSQRLHTQQRGEETHDNMTFTRQASDYLLDVIIQRVLLMVY